MPLAGELREGIIHKVLMCYAGRISKRASSPRCRMHEEVGEHVLAGFPDTLLKLKGLTSLAVSSLGGCRG